MRILTAFLLILSTLGCGASSNSSSPGAKEFLAADKKIVGKSDGIYHGNSEEAQQSAKLFSESIKLIDAQFFSGGKENRTISLTGDEFLTYCQLNESSVLFLVHVPQFKRYKDEVRNSLLELAWVVAEEVTEDHPPGNDLEIAVGLKGTIFYGGTAIGKKGSDPEYANAATIDRKVFYKYFVSEQAAPTEDSSSPSEESSS